MTIFTTEAERRDAILNNTPGTFSFTHQDISDVSSFSSGIHENRFDINPFVGGTSTTPLWISLQANRSAGAVVRSNETVINNAASEFGISANLLKAVIYTEYSRGWYDNINPFGSSTILPTNINESWEALIPGSDAHNTTDNIRLAAKLLSKIEDYVPGASPEDIYSLYNGLGHDKTYENAQIKSTPYFMKEAMEAKAWELDEWHLGEQSNTLKIELTEIGLQNWSAVLQGYDTIDDVGNFFWDSFTYTQNSLQKSVDHFNDLVRYLDQKWDGNLTNAANDIFGDSAITDTGSDVYLQRGNIIKEAANLGGTLSNSSNVKVAGDDEGGDFSLIKGGTTLTAAGKTYQAPDIMNALSHAADAVGGFIQDLAQSGVDWFNNGGAQDAFGSWLSQNVDDILLGDMDGDEALVSLGTYFAGQFLSNFVVTDLLSAEAAIKKALTDHFGIDDTKTFKNAQGQQVTAAEMFAADFKAGLTSMVSTFVISGFDAEQAANAGISMLAGKLTTSVLIQNGFITDDTFFSGGDVTVAVATAVQGLLDFDGDWGQLGVQVGMAVAIFHATNYLVGAIKAGETVATAFTSPLPIIGVDPATIIIGAALSFVASKIFGHLFGGGMKFGPGEFATVEQLWNSIYQVQTVTINGVPTQALVAVNAQGSTVIASGSGIGYILGNAGADVLVGTDAVQTIEGKGGADYLEARGGDDNLLGGDGNDHLNGGDGNDILQGDAGDDIIFGEDGSDTVVAGTGDDFAHLGSGDDIAAMGTGRDYVLASGGDDAVTGDADDDMIDGGYGNDSLEGGDGNDLLLGNLGNDNIDGGAGNDTLFGDEGNDQIYGADGNDFIDGGEDSDILHGENGNDMIIGGDGDDFADGGLGDDNIFGGDGDDVLLGGMDNDYITGEAGDDSIDGGFGDDILIGGVGTNTLEGGEGNDIYVIGQDTLESGNSIIDLASTGNGDTILLSWMTQTQAQNSLTLEQDGDDLKISYGGRLLGTVDDQFVSGRGIERIELGAGKYIDLGAVTYDGTTHLGSFTVAALSGTLAASVVSARETAVEADFLAKPYFWNDTFFEKLSQLAYDEQLGDNTTYTYYDGTEVDSFFKKRGKFGGKYSVYKLDQSGNISGTEARLEYVPQDAEDQNLAVAFGNNKAALAAPYENLINGATVVYSTFGGKNIQDIVVNGTVVSTKVATDTFVYAPGATIGGASIATRLAAGTSYTTDLATKQMGGDLLVGAYWNETIDGKSGDDVLVGNDGNDSLIGADGDDWLFGGDGNDTILAGNGDDIAFGGDGNDLIYGGAGKDAILGSGGNDTIYAEDGNDWIDSGAENDSVDGGAGDDVILGGEGTDQLAGGDGNDVLQGGDGNDTLLGGAGNDTLFSGAGIDLLSGGDGIDLTTGNDPSDIDSADYFPSTAAVNVNLTTGVNTGGAAEGDILHNIERVAGSIYNDTLTGNSGDNIFNGSAGNDSLYGMAGNDFLSGADAGYGAAGSDLLDGGDGFDVADYGSATAAVTINLSTGVNAGQAVGDTISNMETINASNYNDSITGDTTANTFFGNSGNDTLAGMDGDDTLVGGAGSDVLNGGNGLDTVSYIGSSSAVTVYLGYYGGVAGTSYATGGDATGDTITAIENVLGSAYGDTLVGTSGANKLSGDVGNDTISGMGGNDTIEGGNGTDIASFVTMASAININLSTATYSGAAAGITLSSIEGINATNYNDSLTGSAANENFYGNDGNDSISAGDGDDFIIGGNGADTLDGGNGYDMTDYGASTAAISLNLATNTHSGGTAAGDSLTNIEAIFATAFNDILLGNSDTNHFYGGAGNDSLSGQDGNDLLSGGAGTDTLNGGNGVDALDYTASAAAVSVNLTTNAVSGGDAQGDVISNIENVTASNYNDTLTGSSVANYLWGNGGNDTLVGLGGADTMQGGAGADTADYSASATAISLNLATNSSSGGDAAGDMLFDIEIINGTAYNDSIVGTIANESFIGNNGNDTLRGGVGADSLNGGSGTDFADYQGSSAGVTVNLTLATAQSGGDATGDILTGIEGAYGSAFADTFYGTATANAFYGYDGSESFIGDAGADTLDGGNGQDFVIYTGSTAGVGLNFTSNVFYGGQADGDVLTSIEVVLASNYNDTIIGSSASEAIYTYGGADYIYTLDGDDWLGGGAGADTLNGGAGSDYVNYDSSSAAVNLNLSTSTYSGGDAAGDVLIDIENLVGSASYNDTITGSSGANALLGLGGNDTIAGLGGADYLDGGDGFDMTDYSASGSAVNITLTNAAQVGGDAQGDILVNMEGILGSAYNDTMVGSTAGDSLMGNGGNDSLTGGDGDDTLTGGAGNDTLDGGAGIDTVSYLGSSSAVTVNLATNTHSGGDAAGDSLLNFEGVSGSSYNDLLTGGVNDEFFFGNAGDDSIVGGDGNDTLTGGAGADTLDGGNGSDWVSYETASSAVTISLAAGTGIGSDAQGDILLNIENIKLSAYNDTITGSSNSDLIYGMGGNDYLYAYQGNDTLDGGAGTDTFLFHATDGADVINNFEGAGNTGGDLIQLASSGYANFAALQSHILYNSTNSSAVIDLGGGNTITVYGVVAQFIASDFSFV